SWSAGAGRQPGGQSGSGGSSRAAANSRSYQWIRQCSSSGGSSSRSWARPKWSCGRAPAATGASGGPWARARATAAPRRQLAGGDQQVDVVGEAAAGVAVGELAELRPLQRRRADPLGGERRDQLLGQQLHHRAVAAAGRQRLRDGRREARRDPLAAELEQ